MGRKLKRKVKRNLILILFVCILGIISFGFTKEYGKNINTPTYKGKKALNLNEELFQNQKDSISIKGLDKKIATYMQQWQIEGAVLAIMRNDSLMYVKAYGNADTEKGVAMQPNHIMRVASVSKLITAVGIMKLVEEGKLKLSDKVFGENGILQDSTYTSSIKDKAYNNITVEHLLRHEGGFGGSDPMFNTKDIMLQHHLNTPPNNTELAKIVLKKRLIFAPGTSRSYSNFGYLLLTMIIEDVSGQTYDEFIKENILKPAGCYDMHIATNTYKTKRKNEVKYYVPNNEQLVEEFNNSGKKVVRCYGGNNITALQGAGAWVTSIPELARFVASVDGKNSVPDILKPSSIKAMTHYYNKDTFGLGWNDVNPETGWTRSGCFSGTASLIKYYNDGECWIFVTNTSTWKGPRFNRYTSALFNQLRKQYSYALPKRDLFWK